MGSPHNRSCLQNLMQCAMLQEPVPLHVLTFILRGQFVKTKFWIKMGRWEPEFWITMGSWHKETCSQGLLHH